MLLGGRKLVERATRSLLRNRRSPLDIAGMVSYFSEGATELTERLPQLMLNSDREALAETTEQLMETSVPPELAKRVANLNWLFSVLDIVDVATATDQPLEDVATVYFTLGDRLKLHWLRDCIDALPRQDRWQTLARAALRDDLYSQQAGLTAEVIRSVPDESEAPARIDAWMEGNQASIERSLQVLKDIHASGIFDLSTLSVALRELRNLVTSSAPAAEMEVSTH